MASSNNVLHVVIDERVQREQLEELSLMESLRSNRRPLESSPRIFKDYILSSEVFELENSLN